LGALALIWAGVKVGGTGGDLVYRYGAGSAYGTSATVGQAGDVAREARLDRGDDHEGDR
jgi:hypothetical protein